MDNNNNFFEEPKDNSLGDNTENNNMRSSSTLETEVNENSTPYYRTTPGNSYSSPNGNSYNNPYNTPKTPLRKKKSFGATIGKAIAIALIFGLVAGGVFTGVSLVGSKLVGISASSEATDIDNGSSKADSGIVFDETDENEKEADTESESAKEDSDTSKPATISQTATGEAKDLTDVSGIVSEVMPSIVAITNTATVNYRDFWGGVQSQESESCGSGIIISQDDEYLYIASNNHVVSGADTLTVQFSDSKVVEAQVQGTVPSNDLAVVKVAIKDIDSDTLSTIKVATIGDSEALLVGEPSIAIGNALGYGQSVTTGIISALGRSVSTQDETTGAIITNDNLIQTDAAINPGNSGGALLNSKGEVIGINSVKYASTEVEGIGYAIAMADALPILQDLIENGSAAVTQTAYLGIQGGDVSSDMKAYNMPAGVYVAAVIQGTGAANAGLQEGDIITSFEGHELTGMSELQGYLQNYNPGDKVTITIARQRGKGYVTGTVEITLSSASDMN